MFGNFLMKAMIKKQMKGVPEAEQDRIIALIEKNPEFFTKIAQTVKSKTEQGMSQQDAMRKVMEENGEELKKILGAEN